MTNKNLSPIETEEQPLAENISRQRVFWGTLVLSGLLMLIAGYFITILLRQPPSKVIYLGLAVFGAALVTVVASMGLLFRKRHLLALQLLFFFFNGFVVAVIGLFRNRILPASLSILAISSIIIGALLPKRIRRTYSFVALLAFALSWGIEVFNPAWRIELAAISPGPAVALIFGLFLLIFAGFQTRVLIARSLRLRITLWAGAIVLVLSVILVTYSALTARQTAIEAAEAEALQQAAASAGVVRANAEIPLDIARALAQALTAVKDPASGLSITREQVDAMLRQVLVENPAFLGTYTLWEPNAFDGLDDTYRNTANSDQTGRFIPYWIHNDDGSVSVIPLEQYETPGIGDWYLLPRQNKVEMTFAPLIYPINGVDTVMASFVVPILYADTFYGIAGVDAPISFAQELVDQIDLYGGTADAALFTSSGTLVGVRHRPDLANQPVTQIYPDYADFQAQIEAGEVFVSRSPDGEYLRVFAPVDLGQTGKHWAFGLIIPLSVITAEATNASIVQATISLVLIILALLLLWLLTGQVVRPLQTLTTTANTIATGNLDRRADITSQDEVGTLAVAFNSMTAQLQEILQNLEQRVADRTKALATSAEVSRRLSTILDLSQLLKEVVDQIQQAFQYYHAHIYLFDETYTRLVMVGGTGEAGRTMLANKHALPAGRGLVGRAGETNQVVLVPLTTADPNWLPNPLLPETKAELAVPIAIGNQVLGVLDVQHNLENGLRQEDADLLQAIASQVAIAIQNARSYTQTQQRAEREAFIARVGQQIQNATTMEEVLKVALSELGQTIGASRTVVQIGQWKHNGNNENYQ
ncbi:MAG: GAF domain-containing protein [Anaerolineales bacterium]|nr:GAF domain-containing protein [Anaerolineales bacterium]